MSRHDEIMALAKDAADIRASDTAEFYAGRRVSDRNYKAALAELSAAVAELVRDASWRPINEFDAMPQKPRHAVFYFRPEPGRHNSAGLAGTIEGTRQYGHRACTHWMPLPTPPALAPTHHTDKQEPQ